LSYCRPTGWLDPTPANLASGSIDLAALEYRARRGEIILFYEDETILWRFALPRLGWWRRAQRPRLPTRPLSPSQITTPSPLPAGSWLLQDPGFLAFKVPEVEILMPIKKPRGEELTREQQRANQALTQRRLRIEHVNSRVKRCRIVKDQIRLWKAGVRDLVMELCCALHNFQMRLTPWQPMV